MFATGQNKIQSLWTQLNMIVILLAKDFFHMKL